jgi:hypothetical protein
MYNKRGRGRPSSSPPPPTTMNNELSNSSSNKYKNFSLFPEESLDDDGGDCRGKKNTNTECMCWVCHDLKLAVTADEIKSLQKSISKTKEDTNTILDKMKKLEAYFLK